MLRSFLRLAFQISRRIYVRVILFAVLNVVALLAARFLAPFIPAGLGLRIGAGAVDTILQIIASSMLAVTTFSLTIMTGAFSRASSQWTPRTQLLLREDTVTHSVLATFLGAYLYALIAIILRATEFFGEQEIVVLFAVTILVVVMIIVSIIRWIVHLEGLGSLTETARRLEEVARRVMKEAAARPCSGGHALGHPDATIPEGAQEVTAVQSGYVQQIFEDALQVAAEANDARIYVVAPVGKYVHEGDVLARVAGCDTLGDATRAAIRESLPVRDVRSFAQDPLFGVTALAEVACRALSPGINDSGTAIDILHRLAGVIALAGPVDQVPDAVANDRIWVPPLVPDELFHVSFDPIARDGAGTVEVQVAVQHALGDVIRRTKGAVSEAARAAADRALTRAEAALSDEGDMERVRATVVGRVA